MERLPFTRRQAYVFGRRGSTHSFVVDPAFIERAAVVDSWRRRRSIAVENLNLIEPVQVYTGIRLRGHEELKVQLEIAEGLPRNQIFRAAIGSVHQHGPTARLADR